MNFHRASADDDQLNSQLFMHQRLTEHLHFQTIQLDQEHTMAPIFDTIIDHIPAPVDNSDEPFNSKYPCLITTTSLDVSVSDVSPWYCKSWRPSNSSKLDGTTKNFRVTKLFGFFGLERREIQEAKAGDLIAISGMEDIFVGETINRQTQLKLFQFFTSMSQRFK